MTGPVARPIGQKIAEGIGKIFKETGRTVVGTGARSTKGSSRNIVIDDLKERILDVFKNYLSEAQRKAYTNLFLDEPSSARGLDKRMNFLIENKIIKLNNFRIPYALGMLSDVRAYAALKVPHSPIEFRFSAATLEKLTKGGPQYDLVSKLKDIIKGKDTTSFLAIENNGLNLKLSFGNQSITGPLSPDGIFTF